ncbi:MAG: MFS transporter [Bacillota bacterium]
MTGLIVRKLVPFVYSLDVNTKTNLKVETLSAAGFGLFAGAFYPFFAVTAVRLGAAGALLALITAAPFMGQLFAVYWGHKSQESQKLPFVVISGVLSRFTVILLALTRSVELFALLIILHFLLAAAGWPAYTGLMQKIYPMQFRGQIMGRLQFIMGLSRIGVTYMAGLWLDSYGYGWVFIGAGIFGIISSIIYSRIKEPELPGKKANRSRFSLSQSWQLLKYDRVFRIALLGFFVFDLGNMLLAPIYPLFQVEYLGLSNIDIGRLSIFWIGGWFLTAPFWGQLVDRFQPIFLIMVAIGLFLISPLIYFLNLPYQLLMLASFIQGAAGSSLEVGWINLMIKLGGDKSSQYSGIYLTLLGLRGLLGPLLGNLLLGFMEINFLFLVSPVFLVMGIIPFVFLLKQRQLLLNSSGEKLVLE